jgi:hypothetical protein
MRPGNDGTVTANYRRAGPQWHIRNFSFFSILTNPNVPAGSFVVKGVFDEERGLIDMQPVSWITRPFGFVAVGLRGISTDRGTTFEGQITGAFFSCSTFVIRKSDVPS